MERLSFAQVCVDVSFEDDLKHSIPLYKEEMTIPNACQQVIYDWKLQNCMQYITFGHTKKIHQRNRINKEGGGG